jgi:hypothetical protein
VYTREVHRGLQFARGVVAVEGHRRVHDAIALVVPHRVAGAFARRAHRAGLPRGGVVAGDAERLVAAAGARVEQVRAGAGLVAAVGYGLGLVGQGLGRHSRFRDALQLVRVAQPQRHENLAPRRMPVEHAAGPEFRIGRRLRRDLGGDGRQPVEHEAGGRSEEPAFRLRGEGGRAGKSGGQAAHRASHRAVISVPWPRAATDRRTTRSTSRDRAGSRRAPRAPSQRGCGRPSRPSRSNGRRARARHRRAAR